MGYTHYWKVKGELPLNAINDIKKIIPEYRDIIQFEEDDNSEPLISKELIHFNGIGEDGHETFCIQPNDEDFCKTNEKPYDMPVCISLLILKHHLKEDMGLSSDGFWVTKEDFIKRKLDGYWNKAIEYVKQKFGYEFELIPRIHKNKYYSFDIQ